MKKTKKLIILFLMLAIFIMTINYIAIIKQNIKYKNKANAVISNIIGVIEQKYPDVDDSEIIKILNDNTSGEIGANILKKYGVDINDVYAIYELQFQEKETLIINGISILALTISALLTIIIYENKQKRKIEDITNYIEEISKKNYNLKLEENTEDELSNLSNELYKITVMLKEQADTSNRDRYVLQTSLEDISHQLKTPLTSISIMLDNIIENPEMEEQTRKEFIHEISRQIEWINWLVISLLKLSKLDSNIVEFNKKEIQVENLINNVIKNLSIPLDIKQQSIIVSGKKATFIGDYNWQLEAITNIVKNCIEHTPELKNIYINYEENNFYTKIIIRDEGTGIDKKDIKHIFERFYKGKNSSENSIGIGLALAKSIIEKDNGYIICSSKVGEGTTFEIKYMNSL